jgi:hypothetical protein
MNEFVMPDTVGEFSRDNNWLRELRVAPLTRPISFALDAWLADPEPEHKSELEGR